MVLGPECLKNPADLNVRDPQYPVRTWPGWMIVASMRTSTFYPPTMSKARTGPFFTNFSKKCYNMHKVNRHNLRKIFQQLFLRPCVQRLWWPTLYQQEAAVILRFTTVNSHNGQ